MSNDNTGPRSGYSLPAELLELRSSPPAVRADAARNRAAVLDAAAELFARDGVEHVTMDAVAAAAGVGKGTVFRRFGDKAGLAVALLDERERRLQEAILFGPAPLGPGPFDEAVAPRERLAAFVDAYLGYALAHLDLVRLSETAAPGARYRIGAYRFWHRHVTLLLAADRDRTDDGRALDPVALAHALLAPLAAEHLRAMVDEVGPERTREAVRAVTALSA
ncbi:TetR/AcrR family transcriptional regulator [Jiangella gansuensis]|uniref:TetR/AcrR family transcriptional regulator n=1 Tax=Jiangella gansuensis TaxID=281473 RepID=UPI00047940A9|nr:TetR/AcrR family transcriptional regulator [Jiangella gansuensis]